MSKLKLLACIPNFGTHQKQYLDKVLYEYEKFDKVDVDVVLFSTDKFDNTFNINLTQKIFDKSIGIKLSEQPRLYSFENIDKYDLFMHQENDTLITEKNILSFIEGQKVLDDIYDKNSFIHAFIRYEMKEGDSEKYFIDNAVCAGCHKSVKLKDDLVHFYNVHQGGWLVNKSQLTDLGKRGIKYGLSLEDYCSNFYYSTSWPGSKNGIDKKIHKEFIDGSCIYHLPNKYINRFNEFMTLTKLKS